MRKVSSFTFVSLNFFYKDGNNDIGWHSHEGEENSFAEKMLQKEHALMFGRITYEMMAGYWPTSFAMEMMPEVAKGMNKAEKYVLSNTLKKADWDNTKIVQGDIFNEVKKIKQQTGSDITILGSGSIVRQFAAHKLIDEYQLMIDPVILESGTSLFEQLESVQKLSLKDAQTFKNGIVVLTYKPR